MNASGTPDDFQKQTAGWKEIVRKYQLPSKWRSAWQLANTLGPYVLLWVLMYFAIGVSYWIVMPLAILAGAFLVRTFIIFHDCTHGSFFNPSGRTRSWGLSRVCSRSLPIITGDGNIPSITPVRAIWTGAAWGTCGH